jgi:uncharacterized protein YwgA
MNAYDFVHLALLAMGGEVRGKTLLQKRVYFLGVLTDSLEDLGYRPHFYGPYSAEVAAAVDRLRSLGFVEQSVAGRGVLDESGFEVARYDYQLNTDGKRMAETKAKKYPEMWQKIQRAVEAFNKGGELDYMKLSIAAKTFYLLGERKEAVPAGALVSLASKFGWAVTRDQVKEAGTLLQTLGLVTVVTTGDPST